MTHRFYMVILILSILLAVRVMAKPVTVNDQLVWCHYVAWFDLNQTPSAVSNYYDFPLAHPTGDQQKDYHQEVDAAIRMGIDGFLVDLVNGSGFVEQTMKLLDAARGTQFMVSVCLDGFDDPAPLLANKVAAFLKHADKHPNLARIGRKPLITTYAGDRGSDEYWKLFRQELLNAGYDIFLVIDPTTPMNYPNSLDMLYCFNALDKTPSAASTLYPTLRKGAALTSSGKWMAGIGPGYIGSWPLSGRNDYYSGFRGFDQFWHNFENAVKEQASWIHLTTWNDLDETPLQPMNFQFHAYPELTRYWISRWKGTNTPAPKPRLYLAYQREQILGTVQRIELISLPTEARSITVRLELLDMAGKLLTNLKSRTFEGSAANRMDWAIPTAAFAHTPIVEPVIHVQAGDLRYSRRLPLFTLRTGWIANKSSVRVPVHEMSEGHAQLTLKKNAPDIIQATIKLKSTDAVRSLTLYRNDRPIGSFGPNKTQGVRYKLGFTYLQDTQLQVTVSGGNLLNAYYTLDSAAKPELMWTPTTLSVLFGRYRFLAAELIDNTGAVIKTTVNNGSPQTVTIAGLKHGAIDLLATNGQPACRIFIADVDSNSVTTPNLNLKEAILTGKWYVTKTLQGDLFNVRCETTDGRVFFSNTVAPFSANLPTQPTVLLQTAETLDGGAVGGGGHDAFLSNPPFLTPQTTQGKVHPAMVQQMRWTFDAADPWADSAGWNPLHPGSGVNSSYYVADTARVPAVISRQGTKGNCVEFDGKDDIVEIPIRQFPIGAFTVSMDIFPATAGKAQTIIGHVGWQSCPILRILPDGRLQAGREMSKPIDSAKHNIVETSYAPIPVDAWSHVKVTFNEKTVRLYVNDQLTGTSFGILGRDYGNLRIYLGGDGEGHMFKGKLDNVLISSVSE